MSYHWTRNCTLLYDTAETHQLKLFSCLDLLTNANTRALIYPPSADTAHLQCTSLAHRPVTIATQLWLHSLATDTLTYATYIDTQVRGRILWSDMHDWLLSLFFYPLAGSQFQRCLNSHFGVTLSEEEQRGVLRKYDKRRTGGWSTTGSSVLR